MRVWGRCYFTGEEAESQKCELSGPRSHGKLHSNTQMWMWPCDSEDIARSLTHCVTALVTVLFLSLLHWFHNESSLTKEGISNLSFAYVLRKQKFQAYILFSCIYQIHWIITEFYLYLLWRPCPRDDLQCGTTPLNIEWMRSAIWKYHFLQVGKNSWASLLPPPCPPPPFSRCQACGSANQGLLIMFYVFG